MILILLFLALMVLWRLAQANGLPGMFFFLIGVCLYPLLSLGLGAHPVDAAAGALLLDLAMIVLIVLTGHHWLPDSLATLLYDADAHVARAVRMLRELGYRLGLMFSHAPAIWIDPDFAHPGLRLIKSALMRGDFIEARRLFAMASQDERVFMARRIGATRGRANFLDDWLAMTPGCGYAHLVDGANRIHLGWRARGNGTADTVTAHHASAYFQYLLDAQESLEQAASCNPHDGAPLVLLIDTLKGLGERDGLETVYERILQRHPDGFFAGCAMLEALCERWGGTHRDMFDFVDRVVTGLPMGHPLQALPAIAHIEAWMDTRLDHPASAASTDAYFLNPSVAQAIELAWERFSDEAAAVDSIQAGEHLGIVKRLDPAFIFAHNAFAFAFLAIGNKQRAASLLRALGDRVCQSYWQHLGSQLDDPYLCAVDLSRVYCKAWRRAGLAPGVRLVDGA